MAQRLQIQTATKAPIPQCPWVYHSLLFIAMIPPKTPDPIPDTFYPIRSKLQSSNNAQNKRHGLSAILRQTDQEINTQARRPCLHNYRGRGVLAMASCWNNCRRLPVADTAPWLCFRCCCCDCFGYATTSPAPASAAWKLVSVLASLFTLPGASKVGMTRSAERRERWRSCRVGRGREV